MGILNFLFGKKPDIFDADGTVRHKHPAQKWNKWNNRFVNNPDYNWRNHTGVKANLHKNQPKT